MPPPAAQHQHYTQHGTVNALMCHHSVTMVFRSRAPHIALQPEAPIFNLPLAFSASLKALQYSILTPPSPPHQSLPETTAAHARSCRLWLTYDKCPFECRVVALQRCDRVLQDPRVVRVHGGRFDWERVGGGPRGVLEGRVRRLTAMGSVGGGRSPLKEGREDPSKEVRLQQTPSPCCCSMEANPPPLHHTQNNTSHDSTIIIIGIHTGGGRGHV